MREIRAARAARLAVVLPAACAGGFFLDFEAVVAGFFFEALVEVCPGMGGRIIIAASRAAKARLANREAEDWEAAALIHSL
jgi:hypothetical protein